MALPIGERDEAAIGLSALHNGDGSVIELGGDSGAERVLAGGDHADAAQQDDPWGGVDSGVLRTVDRLGGIGVQVFSGVLCQVAFVCGSICGNALLEGGDCALSAPGLFDE